MEAYLSKIGGYEEHVKDVIMFAYALATKYGEAAAAAACEMYDAVAAASNANVPPAEPAQTATYSETAKAVSGTAKNSSAKQIPSTVGRLVKQAGADTTIKNAKRDGAQFAWVPSGDTCAFCITLASRGWQYMSKDAMSGNHAEHIHAHCNCEYAIRFDNKTNYEGYDPDKYLEMYNNAEGKNSKEKINSMRRGMYSQKKTKIENKRNRAIIKMNLQFFAERDLTKQSSTSIKRGIRSLQKRKEIHLRKIENPKEFIEDWDKKTENQKNGLIKHWEKEINNFENSINNRLAELKKRGE